MRILVATTLTQGVRTNDFAFATEHELLVLPLLECDSEPVDGPCGCRRPFAGVTTGKGTTTALVIEHADLTVPAFKAAVRKMLMECGWTNVLPPDAVTAHVDLSTKAVLALAGQYPVGTVLERRGKQLVARTIQRVAERSSSQSPGIRRYQN